MRKGFSSERLEPLILRIRGHRIVLDADLARLYGASTKRFNEAFKRNRNRFPADFAFQLTAVEFESLRSQFATQTRKFRKSLILYGRTGRNLRPVPAGTEDGAICLGLLPSTAC